MAGLRQQISELKMENKLLRKENKELRKEIDRRKSKAVQ
jgi:regulator of replication initiation timing